jgi:hypothetical protein
MDEEAIYIYRPYITVKGRRIFAYERGLKAFKIRVRKDQGKPKTRK